MGDSLPLAALFELMQALFSEWTLFTWPAGFSKGSKPLCVRWTFTFLSSGMVSRGLTSFPWRLRVDIFVTHICERGEEVGRWRRRMRRRRRGGEEEEEEERGVRGGD